MARLREGWRNLVRTVGDAVVSAEQVETQVWEGWALSGRLVDLTDYVEYRIPTTYHTEYQSGLKNHVGTVTSQQDGSIVSTEQW